MATQPNPVGEGLTKDQLMTLIAETTAKALEPHQKAQSDFFAQMLERTPKEKDDEASIEKSLGKFRIGRKMRALALASLDKGAQVTGNPDDIDRASKAVEKHWRPSEAAPTQKWLAHVKATIAAGVANAAGDMIMPEYDPEWIELLRNNAVIRGMARTIPMPRGATTRRKQTGASTAAYQGENDRIAVSNLTIGRVPLSYKKLTAASVVSNDLIRFSGGDADRIVQEDFLRVVGLREDRAFLVGNPPTDTGSPQGIRFQTLLANINATNGTSLANIQADLTRAIRLVQASNVPATPANSCFIMSASTFWAIFALTTTTGDWVFAQGLLAPQPKILGFDVVISTQLEVSNSFIGASSGLVFFVYKPALEIHDSMQRTLSVFPGGAYHDATSGVVLSGISQDETVITCISEHDFLQVFDTAASVTTGYAT